MAAAAAAAVVLVRYKYTCTDNRYSDTVLTVERKLLIMAAAVLVDGSFLW